MVNAVLATLNLRVNTIGEEGVAAIAEAVSGKEGFELIMDGKYEETQHSIVSSEPLPLNHKFPLNHFPLTFGPFLLNPLNSLSLWE